MSVLAGKMLPLPDGGTLAGSGEGILGGIRQALRLVVGDVGNAEVLEDLEQSLAAMGKRYSAVVRIPLLNQYVTVETSHFGNAEDANAAKGTGSNRQNLALSNVGAQIAIAVTLQTVESNLARQELT